MLCRRDGTYLRVADALALPLHALLHLGGECLLQCADEQPHCWWVSNGTDPRAEVSTQHGKRRLFMEQRSWADERGTISSKENSLSGDT